MSAAVASVDATQPVSEALSRPRLLVLALGLLLPLFYLLRVQTGGDQLKLLLLGWEFYTTGDLPPYGTVLSHGGLLPGSLTGLLVGLPFFISESYLLVNLSTLLFHFVAWWILDRSLRGILTPRERLLYTILYWLNPWRVYHSLFLWNPNWVFTFAAIHFWTLLRQRRESSFVASFVQVFSVGLLFQLQSSFLVLVFLSVFLWLRGYQRISWAGILLGIVLSVACLYPWLRAVMDDPSIRPTQSGFPGRGLLKGNPMRALLYWFRTSSFHFSNRMMDYDFSPDLGNGVQAWLGPLIRYVNLALGGISLAIVAFANFRFWRMEPPQIFGRVASDASEREWLIGVTRWSVVALLVTWSISPVTVMHYQVLVVFHLAILPLVLWLGSDALMSQFSRVWKCTVSICVLFILVQGIGSPMYRKGGNDPFRLDLRIPCPMLEQIGAAQIGTIGVDLEEGAIPELHWLSETNGQTLDAAELRAADDRARARMKDLERRRIENGR